MIDTIFIEQEILDHERTKAVLSKFPKSNRVIISRYQEVFNKRTQNFRLQKKQPALILANKHKNFVLPAPAGFGIGAEKNFYFSHMYNCLYDCRYCFLQGMYSSANYVLFVNYEDFYSHIKKTIRNNIDERMTFFSGYDCDSLAFEKISGFVKNTLPIFLGLEDVDLELRTKSVQLEPLLSLEPQQNCIVAFSLMPEELAKCLDNKAPSVSRRIVALSRLAERGWPIGLRFDPLIYSYDWKERYKELIRSLLEVLPDESIHSISYGPLRFPKKMYNEIFKLYPDEGLFSFSMKEAGGVVSYGKLIEDEMSDFLLSQLSDAVSSGKFFQCLSQA
ncbi:MAG: DNA photolyase [Pseudomonadota bacterium]|nr:DNA photolyase [Pseudomonadota bacterium]